MKYFTLTLIASLLIAPPVMAQGTDALIEGAKQCTRHLSRYEREYGIPTHLLSAIASTESGRYHQGLKISVPWPWTINAEGKGYYFDSKAEAVAAARAFQARGVKSMDVGCMQVNLYHHSQAFASLEEAFTPEYNIAYAASFLRSLYEQTGSWKEASGDYHSKTPTRGTQYVGLVYDKWFKIVDKLRAARLQTPDEASQQAMMEDRAMPTQAPAAQPRVTHVAQTQEPQVSRLPEQQGRKVAAYKSPRMNSIQVSSPKNDGIIVVRPDIRVVDSDMPKTIQVAAARTGQEARPEYVAGEARVIRVGNTGSVSSKKSGPNFIFND